MRTTVDAVPSVAIVAAMIMAIVLLFLLSPASGSISSLAAAAAFVSGAFFVSSLVSVLVGVSTGVVSSDSVVVGSGCAVDEEGAEVFGVDFAAAL